MIPKPKSPGNLKASKVLKHRGKCWEKRLEKVGKPVKACAFQIRCCCFGGVCRKGTAGARDGYVYLTHCYGLNLGTQFMGISDWSVEPGAVEVRLVLGGLLVLLSGPCVVAATRILLFYDGIPGSSYGSFFWQSGRLHPGFVETHKSQGGWVLQQGCLGSLFDGSGLQ